MIQKYRISRDPEHYLAWPDVAMADGGKLLCVFSECDQHAGWREYTQVMLCESTDRGRTWTPKRGITCRTSGGETGFWNCARINRLRDGRHVITIDRIYAKESSALPEQCIVYLLFSSDNGATWTEPIETPARGIVPDKLIELDSGRWLLGTHFNDTQFGQLVQRVWLSDTKGERWEGPFIVGKVDGLNLCEVSILSIEGNTVVAFMRENSMVGRDCYKSISRDGGRSWTAPAQFPLPCCHRPTAGFLRDGRIFITYRFIQGGARKSGLAQQLHGAVSDRDSALAERRSHAWTRIMPIDYDRATWCDLGYSGWVQFEDGEIYIVNYIKDDSPEKAQIRGYSMTPQDICIG